MPTSIFTDKTVVPDSLKLLQILGDTFSLWENILNGLSSDHSPISHEWKFYGKNYGWQFKTYLKKRNLFFMIPHDRYFTMVFVFGDRAVAEIEKSDLPNEIKTSICNAKKYAEGRGFAIDVNEQEKIPIINQLIGIKINN